MDIKKIPAGDNIPNEFNTIIEVSQNAPIVKYEVDKETGALFVDRFVPTAMYYPCNYGFIPNTLADDGDPVDVLLVSSLAVIPGAVVKARAIGVLIMEDESGMDEKILAVPITKVDQTYTNIGSYEDLPEIFTKKIVHFFENYKALEKGKWVKLSGWKGVKEAHDIILKAVKNFK
jgi:inorganic pyrophosphatase